MAIVAANTKIGVGALVSGALPSTFTNIGELRTFSGPELTAALIDVTHLASTAREFLTSPIPNNGKVSISVFTKTSDTQHKLLRDAVSAGTKYGFQVEFSDGAKFKFIGLVESFKINAGGVDEALTTDIELQITGAITWTDAA